MQHSLHLFQPHLRFPGSLLQGSNRFLLIILIRLTYAPRASTPVHIRLNAEAETIKREHQKRLEQQQADEAKNTTFAPNIKSYKISNRSNDPIHVRLNAEAEKIRLEQQKRQEEKLAEEMKDATFTPNLHSHSLR